MIEMIKNTKIQNYIVRQSIKEYQVLFLYRPEDRDYWNEKREKGLHHCYIKDNGVLNLWKGEKILESNNDVTLNFEDNTFNSKFKKMRVAKYAPNHWKFYYTTERIVATIPYRKTLKIGDFVELFKSTFKRQLHKNHYIVTHLPHSMLAGIVLRLQDGKSICNHIAFIYKNKIFSQNKIVNYTLYYFDYADPTQAEKIGLRLKDHACNLQLKLLPLVKETQLFSNIELENIRSEVINNLKNNTFEIRTSREKFKDFTIKTLYVGGIPLPIFPRSNCNMKGLKKNPSNKFSRYF